MAEKVRLMKKICALITVAIAFLFGIFTSYSFSALGAGESKLKVLIRQPKPDNEKIFTLEATLPFAVRQACLAEPLSDNCLKVSATIYSSEKVDEDTTANKILVDELNGAKTQIVDIPAAEICNGDTPSRPGRFCATVRRSSTLPNDNRLVVIYQFENPPMLKNDKYSISVKIKDGDLVDGLSAQAKIDFEVEAPEVAIAPNEDLTENSNLSVMYVDGGRTQPIEPKYNLIKVQINLPSAQKTRDSDDDSQRREKALILIRRLRSVMDWLDRHRSSPSGMATIQYDIRDGSQSPDLTAAQLPNYLLAGFAFVGQEISPSPAPQVCNGIDLPAGLPALNRREIRYFCDERITVYLIGKNSLPDKPFLIKVTLKDDPPLELAGVNEITIANAGLKRFVTPAGDAIGTNKALALRSFVSNLDIGVAYTSTVSDVEENGQTIRKRENVRALDLMFAPTVDRYLTKEPKTAQWMTTPFFIDAKISSGKISKDTLSSNRVLIGGGLALVILGNKLKGDETHPADRDKYKLSFRFINASDRDFKRVEAKFNFETLFRFAFLNRPLSIRSRSLDASKLDGKVGAASSVPAGSFGYQIQPTIGLDFGRAYRDKRDVFPIEEQTRSVKRLYLGLDMQFDLTRHFKLSFKNTFYVRGETPNNRFRNYFIGTFETKLGDFSRGAESVFFSFERGDQPPFVGLGANVFKVGYRITTNFGNQGALY